MSNSDTKLPLYIQEEVSIFNNQIWQNGSMIFSAPGETTSFAQLAFQHLNQAYVKFYKMDTLCKLGYLAAEYLFQNSKLEGDNPYQRAMVFQNTHDSLDNDRHYQESIKSIPSPALFVYTLPNIVMGEIAIKYGWKGENTFFVSENYRPDLLCNYAQILLEDHIAKQILIAYIDFTEDNQQVYMAWLSEQESGKKLNDLLTYNPWAFEV